MGGRTYHRAKGEFLRGKTGIVVLWVLLGGCSSKGLSPPSDGGTGGAVADAGGMGGGMGAGMGGNGGAHVQSTFQASLNRKLDILFMVDNSQSMLPLQAKLTAQFPVFMNVLKTLPTGDGSGTGLPDLHVAVVSSDTGPGRFNLPERHCALNGDGGRFQSAPRGTCATAPLASDQHFLATSMNQAVKNYQGDISDAF